MFSWLCLCRKLDLNFQWLHPVVIETSDYQTIMEYFNLYLEIEFEYEIEQLINFSGLEIVTN